MKSICGSKRKKKGKYPYEKGMKVVVSMFEDDDMLNEWEAWTFDKLHGMTWDEVKQEAAQKSRGGKEAALPPYERWEAA